MCAKYASGDSLWCSTAPIPPPYGTRMTTGSVSRIVSHATIFGNVKPAAKPPAGSLADLRRDYTRGGLDESALTPDPYGLFERWLADARRVVLVDASATAERHEHMAIRKCLCVSTDLRNHSGGRAERAARAHRSPAVVDVVAFGAAGMRVAEVVE